MASQLNQPPRKPTKVKQACDCCHTRKIRCDGDDPCVNCQMTELTCTYLAIPKKKGPKGRRIGKEPRLTGKRKEKTHVVNGSGTSKVPPPIAPQYREERNHHVPLQVPVDDYESGFQPSPLLSPGLLKSCVDGFFAHKYPIMPILDRDQIYSMLPNLQNDPEQYGLITALCSAIILQPEILGQPLLEDPNSRPSSEFFINETRRARQYCNHIETPSLVTVQTSFFLFASLFSSGKDNSAWFYIREAMTVLQIQRLHEEATYLNMTDPLYATYCRRTFWLLFVTERAYALQRHRPLTLQRTIDLPTVDSGPESTILSGFLDLVSLFQNFDDSFLSLWNWSLTDSTASPQSLILLQDILKFAIPNVAERTEVQQADLLISRQWLKTMVWQLCVTKGLLSSSPTNESMSFHYPVTIARDVVLVSRLLPPKAFEANGVGILEKVFDIGCSLSDVLLLHPSSMHVSSLEIGPRDYLMELVRILGTVLGGSSKYLRLLAAKADECLQVRIRGSLSESEAPNMVEEIVDDISEDQEMDYERNGAESYHHHSMDEIMGSEIGGTRCETVQDRGLDHAQSYEYSNLSELPEIELGIEESNLPFSPSTPEWSRILGPDTSFRGSFD